MTPPLSLLVVAVAGAVVRSSSYADYWHHHPVSNRGRVYVAGLIPLTSHAAGDARAADDDTPAPDVLQAVLMALSDVNRNRQILPHHDLHLVWNDTKVRHVATTTCITPFLLVYKLNSADFVQSGCLVPY